MTDTENKQKKANYKGKTRLYVIVAVCVVLAAAAVIGVLVQKKTANNDYIAEILEQPVSELTAETSAEPETESGSESESAAIPIDFEKLKDINSDIYAWLEVPGTSVSYPILQHPTDDAYYLTHSYDGKESYYGAVFSQAKFNGTDFSDRCTVLYGHRMKDGSMFAGLSDYMDKDFFDSHRNFLIYTENKALTYEVFAAVPFDDRNILNTWDCTEKRQYWSLLQAILNIRSLDANFIENYDLDFYDNTVILSTCYPGDSSRRYLIVGKLISE